MKGSTTDSALLRSSINGSTATISILAREKAAAPGTSEVFAGLNSAYTSAVRMDRIGNVAFAAITKPSNKTGIWYQPNGGSVAKVFHAGDIAPDTSDSSIPPISATFQSFGMPSMGSEGTFAFVAYLNADGDNAANDKNNGVWRRNALGTFSSILRRGDSGIAGLPSGAKVGHLWDGWLNQNNHGAWRGWVDTAGDGVSAYPADTFGIYTDAGGTMRLILSSGDNAPGIAGTKMFMIDHPVISGAASSATEYTAFIGTIVSGTTTVTTGVNDKAIWRSLNGGTPQLLLRTGDSMPTSQGNKVVADIDLPGSNMDQRPWELPVMDNSGRLLILVTFLDGSTSQVIAP